ncbi:MAG: hypothetical protein H6835_20640, partial [Planctomycetes bacterium]|nr:hypothetical protein [Planctomycetota bacterium]
DASEIEAGSVAAVYVLSTTQVNPGIDLSSFGFTGCAAYVGTDVITGVTVSGSTASLPFSIPGDPGLNGAHVFGQVLTLTPGVNPFGALTSNGLDLGIGAL